MGLRRTRGEQSLLLAALGGAWIAYHVQSGVSINVPPLLVLHWVVAGMVVATHTDKAETDFANSFEIGATVDQILLLKRGEVSGTRMVEAERGRWKVDSYAVRYVEGSDGRPSYFEMAAGDLGLDARVLMFVEHNGGASKRAIRDGPRC